MRSDDTEPLEWTAEMEIDLFYSMVDHKPVGENKHFHMLFIYEKYNNLNERKLNVAQLWQHLSELYDLNSLNENNMKPFPTDQVDFHLPNSEFGAFLKSSNSSTPETIDSKEKLKKKKLRAAIDKYEFDDTEDNSSNISSSSTSLETSTNTMSKRGINLDKESIMSNDNSLTSEDMEPIITTTVKTKMTKTPTATAKRQSSAGVSNKNTDLGENVRKSMPNSKNKRKN